MSDSSIIGLRVIVITVVPRESVLLRNGKTVVLIKNAAARPKMEDGNG